MNRSHNHPRDRYERLRNPRVLLRFLYGAAITDVFVRAAAEHPRAATNLYADLASSYCTSGSAQCRGGRYRQHLSLRWARDGYVAGMLIRLTHHRFSRHGWLDTRRVTKPLR